MDQKRFKDKLGTHAPTEVAELVKDLNKRLLKLEK